MKILQIAQSEKGGGASKVALDLQKNFIANGHESKLLVKFPQEKSNGVAQLDTFGNETHLTSLIRFIDDKIAFLKEFKGKRLIRESLRNISNYKSREDKAKGLEDFNYPFSWNLLNLNGWKPDIIQLHNIGNSLFDLYSLEFLSKFVPVIITLHDLWYLTGHCAHPVNCKNWGKECISCPHLDWPQKIKKDNSHENYIIKKSIYENSNLYLVANSRWTFNMASRSMLNPISTTIINPGVDLSIFKPISKIDARKKLGLPIDKMICLYVSKSGSKKDPYKDYTTIDNSIKLIQKRLPDKILFICVGGKVDNKSKNSLHISYIADQQRLMLYYNCADIFLHAANAESFGLTLIESQACGTPVIATKVGGIQDTIISGKTGFFVKKGDFVEMANVAESLFRNRTMLNKLQVRASDWAKRFSQEESAQKYLDFYKKISKDF